MLRPADFEQRYVHVNGIRMHYAQAGHGPRLLVLLHGFPQCWWAWRQQLALFQPGRAPGQDLAERFTVVAPDLRGYNETDRPSWGYELDVLAQDVVALIHELGHDRAVVAGHDWGGGVAWALAIAHAHLVERLIVLNSPHPALFAQALGTNWRQMLRSWYFLFFQLPWLPEALLRASDFAALERMFRGTTADQAAFDDQDILIYKRALSQPGALTAAINYYRAVVQQGARGMYRGTGMRVAAPTLLIWGERDPALGRELVEGTERFAPDLRVRFIPECSHWVMEERPDLVNRHVLEFLAEASSQGQR
ncbi:MAG: alpha/beta hydrolase [Kouleothrix sp.]|nr:alpha/beta hydrolase [Kouleothrix sp.]